MRVEMETKLWEAIIVAIDNDLDDFRDMGTKGFPELDVRYGKMLQARGKILAEIKEKKLSRIRKKNLTPAEAQSIRGAK